MVLFELESVVDRGEPIRADDIRQTKQALHDLGFYQVPAHGITDFTDDEMFAGIEAFQRDRKLRVDGMMIPDGRTERAINSELEKRGQRKQRAVAGAAQKPTGSSGRAGFGLLRPQSSRGEGHFAGPVNASLETDGNDNSNKTRNTEVATHETSTLTKIFNRLSGRGDRRAKEKGEPHKPAAPKPSPARIPDPPDGMKWSTDKRYYRRFFVEGFTIGGIKTEGPIRIDVENAGRLRNRLIYSVIWVALDEEGNEIPESSAHPRVTEDYDSDKVVEGYNPAIGGVLKPPFDAQYGYKVYVKYLPRTDNSNWLTIHGSAYR